jgi:hypothetical protein
VQGEPFDHAFVYDLDSHVAVSERSADEFGSKVR